jgi:hypothetical protein
MLGGMVQIIHVACLVSLSLLFSVLNAKYYLSSKIEQSFNGSLKGNLDQLEVCLAPQVFIPFGIQVYMYIPCSSCLLNKYI